MGRSEARVQRAGIRVLKMDGPSAQGFKGERFLGLTGPMGRRVLKFDGPSGRGLRIAALRQCL